MPTCPSFDADSWCSTGITAAGGAFAAICPEACADTTSAWAMPCTWMAIKSLPETCAGTYVPDVTKAGASANAENVASAPNPLTLGGKAQLHSCDEHAVCFSCFNAGNPGTTDDAKYCEAVAAYYGGYGTPLVTDDGSWTLQLRDTPAGFKARGDMGITELNGEVGANSAFRAITEDFDFWCSADTLAAIEDGSFAARYAPGR